MSQFKNRLRLLGPHYEVVEEAFNVKLAEELSDDILIAEQHGYKMDFIEETLFLKLTERIEEHREAQAKSRGY